MFHSGSQIKVRRRFEGTYCLHRACLAYSSAALKMEAVYSSESFVNICLTTLRHIPEDNTSDSQRPENPKPHSVRSFRFVCLACHFSVLSVLSSC
jgi:hypothetical protein